MEIANLKLKITSGSNLSVEKVERKIDKDKFSACAYCIFYVLEFKNQEKKTDASFDPSKFIMSTQPKLRKR